MLDPITSGSKYGIDHPPCSTPPSVSSSAPPGACTTPSRLMNSLITIRMHVGPCHGSELIAAAPGTGVRSCGQRQAVGSAFELPAPFVHGHVVPAAQQRA